MNRTRVLAAAGLAGLLAGAAIALDAQQTTFRARTDLVPVYVVVVDADGQPVMDLTAADFTLTDRGRPQDIAVFDAVVRRAVEPDPAFVLPPDVRRDVANNRALIADRLVVIVVDDLHLYKDRTERARLLTRQLIDELAPGSSMAMLLTSRDRGTQVTDDPAELHALVDQIKGRRGFRRPAAAIDRQGLGFLDPEMPMEARMAAIDRTMDASLQDFFDNMTLYKTLQDAARLLQADDGRRKAFVLVSEGVAKDLSWLPSLQGTGSTTGDLSFHEVAILNMVRSLRRANVSLYGVDPRGLVRSEDLLRECLPPPRGFVDDPCSHGFTAWDGAVRQAQQGLETTAAVSGGFAVTNTDDFAGGIARIRSDLDNYYLLGFRPSQPDGKGFRELSVRVARPGLTLRFRQGYEVADPDPPPKGRDDLTQLALGFVPSDDLPMRLYAAAFPGTANTARVAVTIEIAEPFRDLADEAGHVKDELRYTLLAADLRNGRVARQLANTATVSSAQPLGEAVPPDLLFQVPMTLVLPPGRYQLRASAVSARLGRGGSVYLTIDVPDFRRGLQLSGLVVGGTLGPRLPSARPPSPGDLIPFSPSLNREFHRSDTLRVLFDVVRQGGRPVDVRIELVNHEGRVATTVHQPLAATTAGRVDVALPLERYQPGAYRLRVTATMGGSRAQQETGLVIR